ncbi:MAG: hypothetical protein ABIQ95_00885 [Bdellovibrionia bacterium]
MAYDQGGNCWNCGVDLSVLDYGRADTCRKCGRDTKVCKGCIYSDKGSNNDCREPQAERVVEKERSNFCDYFKPSTSTAGKSATGRDEMKEAAEALFKK